MTTNITLPSAVVEQALDALEAVCGGRCNAEYNPCWQREVAETLRAALAQQAEPVEPVAWADKISFENAMKTGKGHDVWPKAGDYETRTGRALIGLYTAPPQRKPLTDEEFDALCKANSFGAVARNQFPLIPRAMLKALVDAAVERKVRGEEK